MSRAWVWLALSSSTAAARTLTAEDAVRLALAESPAVDSARAGVDKADAEAEAAFLQHFPKVALSAGYTRLDQVPYVEFDASDFGGSSGGSTCDDIDPTDLPTGWTVEMATEFCELLTSWMTPSDSGPTRIEMGTLDNGFVTATLEQVLYAGGAIHRGRRAAERLSLASGEQERLARQQVAFQAESDFYTLAMVREAEKVTADALATVGAYVTDLQNLADVGMASKADLLAAQARLSQARLDALRAHQGASLAELALKLSLGLPADEPLELRLGEVPVVAVADAETLRREALRSRPDLAALDHGVVAMDHLAAAAWASWLPALVAQGNLNWRNPNYALEPEWYRSADLTLVASWALWDRGAALTGARAARASRRQVEAQRRMLRDVLDIELAVATRTLAEADEELAVARTGEAQASEALRLEQDRFAAGVANNTELLAAQAALAGARLAVVQADTRRRIARASLRKALGQDPQENGP